jgi:hypothetical protein
LPLRYGWLTCGVGRMLSLDDLSRRWPAVAITVDALKTVAR